MGLFGRRPADGFAERAAMDNPDAGRMMPASGFVPPKRTFLDKLGLLADAFSGNDMNRRQLEQQDMQAFQQWRLAQQPEQEFQQWQRQKLWEMANRPPQEPNALERNYEFIKRTAPGTEATYLDNFARNGGGAPQLMNVPGVGVVSIPKAGAAEPPAGPPAAAIDHLRKNPGMASYFDRKYGPGASQRFLGGAPSQGGATFR